MKKGLFIAVTGTVLLTSCKKDWSCVCTDGSISAVVESYTNVTKKVAKDKCQQFEDDVVTFDSTISCSTEKK